jgi:tetratricopeptide (TPR) repeat protein
MSDKKRKILITIAIAFVALLIISALLFYYQKQGIIKIFPTEEEKTIKTALEIDLKKFQPAEGLDSESFEKVINELIMKKEVVLVDPKNPTAWHDFAALKQFLNDHQGAADAWEMSYKLQPYNFRTALNLATTYQYFIKDFEKSEYYYKKVLELQPGMTSAFEGLMDLYRYNLKNENDKYEPLVLQAIEGDPANTAGYYSNLVSFYMSKENLDEDKAIKYWKEVNNLDSAKALAILEDYPKLKELAGN